MSLELPDLAAGAVAVLAMLPAPSLQLGLPFVQRTHPPQEAM